MTKTKTKSRRVPIYRRPITIIALVLLAICVAVVAFCLLRPAPDDTSSTPHSSTTGSESDLEDFPVSDDPLEKVVQFEGEDPNDLDELTGFITLRSVSGGKLTVVASIDQYLTSESSCRLALKDSAGAEVLSVGPQSVTAEATSSVCGPFTADVSRLSGTYTIDITITSPDKTGHITSEINIK